MIALIDYGAGNPTSVRKAFAVIGAEIFVPQSPDELDRAEAAVVPGVGHFRVTHRLAGGWTDAVRNLVASGRPLLGICVGMQWLFETSEEAPEVRGLGIFPGRIVRLDPSVAFKSNHEGHEGTKARRSNVTVSAPDAVLKVPHVGWNSLAMTERASIVEGVADGAQVYFTHSYAPPIVEGTVAVTTHGVPFASVVQRGLVAGVQFHPEKSGEPGLQMLRNFVALAG